MTRNQKRSKELIIENLAKIPIVSLVCEKSGISRATYYRWLKEDEDFRNRAECTMSLGTEAINDLCESKIISKVQQGDSSMIKYWLGHNHSKYKKYSPTQREKKIMGLPLVRFADEYGNEYNSIEEYNIAEKKRIEGIVEANSGEKVP